MKVMERPELRPQIFIQIKVDGTWHRIDIVSIDSPFSLEKLDIALQALFPQWMDCIIEPFHGARFVMNDTEFAERVHVTSVTIKAILVNHKT